MLEGRWDPLAQGKSWAVEGVGYVQAHPMEGGAPWREERHCTPLNAAVPSYKRLTRLLHPHS